MLLEVQLTIQKTYNENLPAQFYLQKYKHKLNFLNVRDKFVNVKTGSQREGLTQEKTNRRTTDGLEGDGHCQNKSKTKTNEMYKRNKTKDQRIKIKEPV